MVDILWEIEKGKVENNRIPFIIHPRSTVGLCVYLMVVYLHNDWQDVGLITLSQN